MPKKPPPYQSILEIFPDHAKAIGMTSIEMANLDIHLGYLFAAILRIDAFIGEEIYLTPNQGFGRLALLETAINCTMKPDAIDARHLISIHARAKRIVENCHRLIYDSWGTNPAGEVARRSIRGYAEMKPVPLPELERSIDDIRILISEIREATAKLERDPNRIK